jgi:hypothetical protein
MNSLNALNSGAQTEILTGRTEVIVKKREIDGGREKISTIHKGIVVQQTTGGFVRVYNPLPTSQGGDTSPENAEWYPLHSKLCWCEVTHQREEHRAMPTPATLR